MRGGVSPDSMRNKERLENFRLDELSIVGLLAKRGRESVIVRQPDGQLHTITIGNYMGEHHGRITAINRNSIALVELHKNKQGYWQEYEVRLAIGGQRNKFGEKDNDVE